MSRRELERLRNDRKRRSTWVEEDPSKLFRLLALDDPSPEDRAEFERRLSLVLSESSTEIPSEAPSAARSETQAEATGPRRAVAWGRYVAVAALLVMAVWVAAALRPTGPPEAPTSIVADENSSAGTIDSSLDRIQPAGFQGAALHDGNVHGIEVLATPGDARVVDLSVGQTRVVMIFDKELDL